MSEYFKPETYFCCLAQLLTVGGTKEATPTPPKKDGR